MAGEASHQLRQVLSNVGTRLDMLYAMSDGDTVTVSREKLERARAAIEEATEVVDAYLDPAETAKLVIRIEPASFDLAELLGELPTRLGPYEARPVETDLQSAWVEADRAKVQEALTGLSLSFLDHADPDHPVLLRVYGEEPWAHGFLGLHDSCVNERRLVESLHQPLDLSQPRLDPPFARALFERHGGSFQVERVDERVGFGFRLALDEDRPKPQKGGV